MRSRGPLKGSVCKLFFIKPPTTLAPRIDPPSSSRSTVANLFPQRLLLTTTTTTAVSTGEGIFSHSLTTPKVFSSLV